MKYLIFHPSTRSARMWDLPQTHQEGSQRSLFLLLVGSVPLLIIALILNLSRSDNGGLLGPLGLLFLIGIGFSKPFLDASLIFFCSLIDLFHSLIRSSLQYWVISWCKFNPPMHPVIGHRNINVSSKRTDFLFLHLGQVTSWHHPSLSLNDLFSRTPLESSSLTFSKKGYWLNVFCMFVKR